jgi:hypothetical protein
LTRTKVCQQLFPNGQPGVCTLTYAAVADLFVSGAVGLGAARQARLDLGKPRLSELRKKPAAQEPEPGTLAGLKDLAGVAVAETMAAPQQARRQRLAVSESPRLR